MRFNRLVALVSPAIGVLGVAVGQAVFVPEQAWGQAPIREADLRIDSGPRQVSGPRQALEQRTAMRAADDLSAAAAAYQRHEYALQADGNLLGKVHTIDSVGSVTPARVRLTFVHNGQVVGRAQSDEQGTFQASGLSPGYYSVVAAGQSGFSAVAVRILPPPERPEPPKANTIGRSKTVAFENGAQPAAGVVSIPLNVSAIQPIDVRAAFYLAQRYVPGMNAAPTPYSASYRNPPRPQVGNKMAAGRQGANAQAVSADTEGTALSEAALDAYERSEFPSNPDGTLSGQLRMVNDAGTMIPADVMLFFLRGGRVAARAQVDGSGRFTTDRLEAGYYSVVAAGPSGFAAAGIRVVPAVQPLPVPKANSISQTRMISAQAGGIPLNLAPVPVQDVAQVQEIAQQDNPGGVGDTPPAGGAPILGGGGPAGGGGGGGGGLGLGAAALLAAGIGGGIAAAAGGDDGGGGTTVTTTTSNSPSSP